MMKVVINVCSEGFPLSTEAKLMLGNSEISDHEVKRHDPALIKAVETLGDRSWGNCSEFNIIEIPDNINYSVYEYDGLEFIVEDGHAWHPKCG